MSYTIHHIPFKSKPAFARLLAATLKDILYLNTTEAWLKLFLLPKCILLSCQRHGRRHKPININQLCDRWMAGQIRFLWDQAVLESSKVAKITQEGKI